MSFKKNLETSQGREFKSMSAYWRSHYHAWGVCNVWTSKKTGMRICRVLYGDVYTSRKSQDQDLQGVGWNYLHTQRELRWVSGELPGVRKRVRRRSLNRMRGMSNTWSIQKLWIWRLGRFVGWKIHSWRAPGRGPLLRLSPLSCLCNNDSEICWLRVWAVVGLVADDVINPVRVKPMFFHSGVLRRDNVLR